MSQVPDEILLKYREMGFGEMHIKQCWGASNGQEARFNEIIIGESFQKCQIPSIPEQKQPLSNIKQQHYLNRMREEANQMNMRKALRKNDQFVGLQNIGNTCSINSVFQFFHSIPQIYTLLIECDNKSKNCYGKFVYELQTLFTELTASNQEFINPITAIKSISFESSEQGYIGIQQDIVEIFNLILTKFDKCIRRLHQKFLMETNLQRVELFGNPELNQLFQIIFLNDHGINEYHPNLLATLNHESITKFLQKEFKNKIVHLPNFLRISVNRISFKDGNIIKLKDNFFIDETLNLDMCIRNNQNQNQQELIRQQNTVNGLQKEIARQKNNIENLLAVIKLYEEEDIFIELIKILKSKYNQLEQQLRQLEGNYQQQAQIINNLIHSIVIHFGADNLGHNFIYLYNFFLGNWMKVNDCSVLIVGEKIVKEDAQKYAQLVTYVDTQMIPKLREHYKYIQTVGNLIASQPDKSLQQIELLKKVPQNICELVSEKNKRNYQSQLRQFN